MISIENVSKNISGAKPTEKRNGAPVYALSFEYLGGKDVMPIGGWWGPYKPLNPVCDLTAKRFYEDIKACGVNHITVSRDNYASNPQGVLQGMDYAEECGLGMFVHDTTVPKIADVEELKNRLNEYRYKKNCLGFHVFDEPLPNEFDWIQTYYNNYASLGESEQCLYTNLYPVYGKTMFEKFDLDYDGYLEEFLKRVPTKFLSYDYYPFYFKGEGIGGAKKYFGNLSSVRKAAKKYKIPFWVFLQAGGQWQCVNKPSIENYPNREEMFWNMHTCMAYGAKAFQYFTLIQPEEYTKTDVGVDYRRIGLIGFDGEKNEWYPIAKEINEHIAFVDEVMMNAENLGVIPVGEYAKDWVCEEEKLSSFRELLSVDGKQAIVGCFDYLGKTALYIANASTTENAEITLHFDCERAFTVYKNEEKEIYSSKSPKMKFSAGEGLLIVLD